jgi:hypothetical protein
VYPLTYLALSAFVTMHPGRRALKQPP